jgi:glycosyltransferase involved in cell wall biosynthesis
MERLATKLGVRQDVDFLGCRADVPELLASAHVLILSSGSEAFPISVLEGMRAGLPVVASDVGGVGEAVLDRRTGFLVPRGDERCFRSCLESLIGDPALRGELGDAGRRRFLREFTAASMIEGTASLYREAVANRWHRRGVVDEELQPQ